MIDATSFGVAWLVRSTALLAAGLVAGRLLRRRGPAVQSAVYRATLAAVLACPAASALLGAMGVAGFALRPAEAPAPAAPQVASAFVPALPDATPEAAYDDVEPEVASLEPGPAPDPVARGAEDPAAGPFPWMAAGASIWALGASLLLARMAMQQFRVARLRATATDVDAESRSLCDALARALGVTTPRLGRSPFVPGPCLDGLLRPMILLPEEVDGDERDAIAHELAHLARRDAWWNLARRLASALLWPQPLAWRLSRRLEATAEEVCDDVVVSLGADRSRYADLLVATAGRGVTPLAPAAVGMVSLRSASARRVARILDASRPLSTRAGRRAVAAVLAVGLAATGFAGLFNVARKAEAEPPAPAEDVAPEPPAAAEPGAVAGQVVDEAGRPVARATVAAWRSIYVDEALQAVPREVARTAADDDGRFHLPAEALKDGVRVVVLASGFHAAVGPARNLLDPSAPVLLRRGEPTTIEGFIDGPEGRPVAGARVEVRSAYPVDPTESDAHHARVIFGGVEIPASVLGIGPATTDADGRFRIDGLCRGDGADLRISGVDVADRATRVVLRPATKPPVGPLRSSWSRLDDGKVHELPVEVAMEAARAVEGVVRDVDSGEPIAGAIVSASFVSARQLASRVPRDEAQAAVIAKWSPPIGWPPAVDVDLTAITDAQGRYRIAGAPRDDAFDLALAVFPPADGPYLHTRSRLVPRTAEARPIAFDIDLKRGVLIEGRVLDERGVPVDALVDYYPSLANPDAKALPQFDPNVLILPWGHRHRTDAEGRFRLPGLPGAGVVGVRAANPYELRAGLGADGLATTNDGHSLAVYDQVRPTDFNAVKAVEIPEGVATFAAGEVRLDRGRDVRLRVVDEAGRPAIGALVGGTSPRLPGLVTGVPVDENGEVAIRALARGERRAIRIRHGEGKLGAFLALSAEDVPEGRPLVVTIRPFGSVSGRFVDSWGRPVAGRATLGMTASEVDAIRAGTSVRTVEVDAQGRFRIDDLLPGEGFGILWLPRAMPRRDVIPGRIPGGFSSFLPIGPLKVEPGRTADLGTIDVDSGRRADEPGPAQIPPPKGEARLVRTGAGGDEIF
ncbi:MAG: hypothetical protein BGO49_22265 [Planctomycetales bacterium 71-10]|nr:MAG: hypothetical protein BGO49_22265 [Planctomycetales bacterium 71-10]